MSTVAAAIARRLLTRADQDLERWQTTEVGSQQEAAVAEGVRLRTALGQAFNDLARLGRDAAGDPWTEPCGVEAPELAPYPCERTIGHDGPHDVFPFPRVEADDAARDAAELERPTIDELENVLTLIGLTPTIYQRDRLEHWLVKGEQPIPPF